MKIFIQTRGKTADYAFLGDAPSNRWWLDFRDATSFEQPTLIVRGDRKEWHCFLSGIPSSRVDRVGTAVRYSVALEGSCCVNVETVLSLVAAWLDDATSSRPKNYVQLALDNAFDEATVERLLHIRGAHTESANEVERLALEALGKLGFPTEFVGKVTSESWVGSTTSLDAKNEFLARCSQLILGDFDGSAAVLNLLGTADEAVGLAGKLTSLAALIDDEFAPLKRIVPIEKKKARQPLPAGAPNSETDGAMEANQPSSRSDPAGNLDAHPDDAPPRRPSDASRPLDLQTDQLAPVGVVDREVLSPTGEFPQHIYGSWSRLSTPAKLEKMEFQLRGTWGLKVEFTQTARLEGTGSVSGLTGNSSMSGILNVTLPTGKCEIRIEFSDPRGTKYIIEAAIGSIAGGAWGKKLTGHLAQEGDILGKVKLEIDWAPLKEATLSFGKKAARKLTDRLNFLRKD